MINLHWFCSGWDVDMDAKPVGIWGRVRDYQRIDKASQGSDNVDGFIKLRGACSEHGRFHWPIDKHLRDHIVDAAKEKWLRYKVLSTAWWTTLSKTCLDHFGALIKDDLGLESLSVLCSLALATNVLGLVDLSNAWMFLMEGRTRHLSLRHVSDVSSQ